MADQKELSVLEGQFSLAPRNLTEAMEFSKLIANSEICPTQFKGKAGDVLVAVQMGMEVGLKPLQAIQNIAVINGRPTMWGDAVKGLVDASGHLEYCVETWDAAKQTATCRVKRKGRPEAVRTFSMEDAKRAGLASKDTYIKYGSRMCQMRARSYGLRDEFADVLKGLNIREEVEDFTPIAETPDGTQIGKAPPRRKSEATPAPAEESQKAPEDAPKVDQPKISDAQRKRLFAILHESSRTDDELKMHLKEVYGLESSKDIATDIYDTVVAWAKKGAQAEPGENG